MSPEAAFGDKSSVAPGGVYRMASVPGGVGLSGDRRYPLRRHGRAAGRLGDALRDRTIVKIG